MTRERGRGLLLALALALLAVPGASRAQLPLAPPTAAAPPAAAPAAQKPAAPAPPEAIPLAEIAQAGDRVDAFLRNVSQELIPPPELALIQESLGRRRKEVDAESKRLEVKLSTAPQAFGLIGDAHSWEETASQLQGWQDVVTQRLTDISKRLTEVQRQRTVWDLTAKEARKARAPDAVLDHIADVRRKLDRAGKDLSKRRDELLDLQTQIAALQDTAKSALDAIEARRQAIRSSLLVRDSAPLWRALAEFRPSGSAVAALTALGRDMVQGLAGFASGRAVRVSLHLLLMVLTALLALRARRGAARWSETDTRRASLAPILERPFSSACLVGVIAAPLIYQHPPPAMGALMSVVALFPMARLLPRLAPPSLRPAFLGLAGLMAANVIRHSLDAEPALERAVLFAEAVAAAGYLVSMLRPAALARVRRELHAGPWLGLVLAAALFLMTAVAGADLMGWTQLARAVGGATLASAMVGALLYGGARLLRASLGGLLGGAWVRGTAARAARRSSILTHGRWVINAAAALLWIRSSFFFFDVWQPARRLLAAILGASAHAGTISVSLGDILFFAVTLAVSLWLARFLREILEADLFPKVAVSRGAAHATSTTVQYLVAVFGVILAFAGAGVDFSRFTLLAGALGVGVGFGLQNIVENFVAGLILLYERPIQEGDTVEMGELMGEVRRIGIRSSTVRTWQGAEVIVPNSNLISDKVINWTLSDRTRRIDMPVGVAYGTDPKRVIDLLLAVARTHPDVLERPEPVALFKGFGDSSLDFELRVWTGRAEVFLQVKSDIAVGIHGALAEAGITVPFPQRDLHVQSMDPAVARALGRTDGGEEPGAAPRSEAPASGASDPFSRRS